VYLNIIGVNAATGHITPSGMLDYAGHNSVFANLYPDTTTTYTVTARDVCGKNDTSVFKVTVASTIGLAETGTICTGSTYNFNGHILTAGGIYSDTFTSVAGCDSMVTLHLTVKPAYDTAIITVTCQNTPINGHDSTGIYFDTLTSASGCDSIVTLYLTVIPPYDTVITVVTCPNAPFNGYDSTGIYTDTLTASSGCDSIVTLNLIVYPLNIVSVTDSICKGDTVKIGFKSYIQSGRFTDTLQSTNGCDSIVRLALFVDTPARVILTSGDTPICPDDSIRLCATKTFKNYYWVNGDTLPCIDVKITGSYYLTITDSNNCRAVSDTVNISIYQTSAVTIGVGADTLTASGGSNYQWYLNNNPLAGDTLPVLVAYTPGNYTVSLADEHGCINYSTPVFVAGINDLSYSSFSLYPNPTSDYVTIAFTPTYTNAILILKDITGRQILQTKLSTSPQQLPTGNLPAGVYMVTLNANGQAGARLLIKN
jgi:hypothetical protein